MADSPVAEVPSFVQGGASPVPSFVQPGPDTSGVAAVPSFVQSRQVPKPTTASTPTSWEPGKRYTHAELTNLWVQNGGDPNVADLMGHVAMSESSGLSNATGQSYQDRGGTYRAHGLWQVSDIHGNANWDDPVTNVKKAIELYKARGMEPWEASRVQKSGNTDTGWGQYAGSSFSSGVNRQVQKLQKAANDAVPSFAGEVIAQQTRGPLQSAATLSVNQPNFPNPHQDTHARVSQHLNALQNLDAVGKKYLGAGYRAGSKELGSLVGALQWAKANSFEATLDVLNSTARVGVTLGNDVAAHQDTNDRAIRTALPGWQTQVLNAGRFAPQVNPIAQAETAVAAIQTAADYFLHPGNLAKYVQAIRDPKELDVVTDTLMAHQAHLMGLPDPSHWTKLEQLAGRLADQTVYDPQTYVNPFKWLKTLYEGASLAKDAVLGTSIAHTLGSSMGKIPGMSESAAVLKNMSTTMGQKYNDVTGLINRAATALTKTRPDLDENIAAGHLVRMGMEQVAHNIGQVLTQESEKMYKDLAGFISDKFGSDSLPIEFIHRELERAYKFGTAKDAAAAVRQGVAYGWKPTAEMATKMAQGLLDYGGQIHPQIFRQFENAGADASKWFYLKTFKSGAVQDFLKTGGQLTADELTKLSKVPMIDLLKSYDKKFVDALTGSQIAHLTAAAIQHGSIRLKKPLEELGLNENSPKFSKLNCNWVARNINTRMPVRQLGGELGGVQDFLNSASQLYRKSINLDFLPHALRNVGLVTFLRGGPYAAVQGVKKIIGGVSKEQEAMMRAAGSWSTFWKDSPSLMQKLTFNTAFGGVAGVVHGYTSDPHDKNRLEHAIEQGGIGAATGAGLTLGAHATHLTDFMDKLENAWRAGYHDYLDKTLGVAKSADELYARGAKVANDIGGYENVSRIIHFFQGIGGAFVAYRMGTALRAGAHALATDPRKLTIPLRAESAASGAMPANNGNVLKPGKLKNSQNYRVHARLLGPIEETAEATGSALTKNVGSEATIGPVAYGVMNAVFNRAKPSRKIFLSKLPEGHRLTLRVVLFCGLSTRPRLVHSPTSLASRHG